MNYQVFISTYGTNMLYIKSKAILYILYEVKRIQIERIL